MDILTQIKNELAKTNYTTIAGLGVGLVVGGSASYLLAKRKYEADIAELENNIYANAKAHFEEKWAKREEAEVIIEPEKPALEELVAGNIIDEEGYDPNPEPEDEDELEEKGDPELEEIATNIFTNRNSNDISADDFKWEEETARRGEVEPYILHVDEYLQNEYEDEQVSVTYYAGDDVVADDRDAVIQDVDSVLGEDNLERFGYGSKDRNIVYIRNPRLGVAYEVCHSTGKFAHEVLGFLEHGDNRRPRKFKVDLD